MRRALPLIRINSSLSPDWTLNTIEVEKHRIQYGENEIVDVKNNQWLELIIETAKDPMIWFLIMVSILFAILKNNHQALILLLATIPLIGMDIFLLWRTQVSTRNLSSRLAVTALVIRNGIERIVSTQ